MRWPQLGPHVQGEQLQSRLSHPLRAGRRRSWVRTCRANSYSPGCPQFVDGVVDLPLMRAILKTASSI